MHSMVSASVTTAGGKQKRDEDAIVQVLVDNYSRFLAFLERRVGSRETAEDILQDAFVRGLDRTASIRAAESVTAWFYRVLRNALADHYRKSVAEQRVREKVSLGREPYEDPLDEDLWRQSCDCVRQFIDTLKPEYAHALHHVDLDGAALRVYAKKQRISANNAAVRVHRARRALKRRIARSCATCATHRCLDCDCRNHPPGVVGRTS
jgi:RNA polymerase sigma-70 factor (ECF subfamily)